MQDPLRRTMNTYQYGEYLRISDAVGNYLLAIHGMRKSENSMPLSNDDLQIVQMLRQHSTGPAADKNAVMATANAVFGKTDQTHVQKVLNAYNNFISAKGPKAFETFGGHAEGGSAQSPSPDAQQQEQSPHALNNTAQPAQGNAPQETGSNAPGAALTQAAPEIGKDDAGEGGAADPHHDAARQAAEDNNAQNAGGESVTPRISKDSTIGDEASNIASDDTGNLTQGDETHRKQGGQPTLVRGKKGGVYELTQNNNYRRISKKELADRAMGNTKHHSQEDPDNPSSHDPAARYGYVHHHETALHGLPALHPDNVEGGIKGMDAADLPDGMADDSEDPDDTFNSQHPGKQDVPDGHMTGKTSVTPQDIIDQIQSLSEFSGANGKQGHRLSWISDGKSEKSADGTKISSQPTMNAIKFSFKKEEDGSLTIQPKVQSFPLKGKGVSGTKKGQLIASGEAHPDNLGDATKQSKIYAPLHITKEQMESGDLSELNQMMAHLAAYAHINRGSEANASMDHFAKIRGSENEAHPKHQFKHFAGQSSSPMARSWQRKTDFAAMSKGINMQYTGWKRFRKSAIGDDDENGNLSLPEWNQQTDQQENSIRDKFPPSQTSGQMGEDEWMQNRINSAVGPSGSREIHVPIGYHEGDLSSHPVFAAHMQELQNRGIPVTSVDHDRVNGIAKINVGEAGTGAPATPAPPTVNGIAPTINRLRSQINNPNSNKQITLDGTPTTKSWKKSGFDSWHTFVAQAMSGATAPTMRNLEGAEADNVPASWSEQKIARTKNAGVKNQTGAKPSDWIARVQLAMGNDSINGGLPEQDKSIRDVFDPYAPSPLEQVIAALSGHDDGGYESIIDNHNWQMQSGVPISQFHGDSGTDYDEAKMMAMKQKMRAGKSLPPIIAIQHGPSSYHVIDGKHRIRAMRSLNKYEANCLIGTPKKRKK